MLDFLFVCKNVVIFDGVITVDMQCNCMMGLFSEIKRAWLTIDSDIFVWNYEDGYGIVCIVKVNFVLILCYM